MTQDKLGQPATIFDIAAAAGVSIATADRALNGRKGVAEKTRQAVLDAAARLNWTPNPVAQSLSRKSVITLDVILPEPSNPFMQALVATVENAQGAFRAFRISPRPVLVPDLDVQALVAALHARTGRPEGVALVGLQHPAVVAAINRLVASGTPVVTLVSDVQGSNRTAYVGVDNHAAGRAAGVMLGRYSGGEAGQVVIFAGTPLYTDIIQRQSGFGEVMRARFPRLRLQPSVWNVEDDAQSYDVARELLRANPDITGIYVAGGGQAGVIRALREAGRADKVILLAHDVIGPLEEALRAGVIDVAINQNAELQVARALEYLSGVGALPLPTDGTALTPIDIRIAETLPAQEGLP